MDLVTFLSLVITYSGGILVVSLITILNAISLTYHNKTREALKLILVVLATAVSVLILKIVFGTARPVDAFYIESSPSFPSGHAALAMAHYGFLFLTIWKHDKHHLKHPSLILLALLIFAIGWSRLYLNVHFLIDVLAGYLIGVIWIVVINKTISIK